MSRSTTMLMLVLVPMVGQAAIVQPSLASNTHEEAVCRSNMGANGSRSRGYIRADGRLYRLHQVDTGGMLAMSYSYYGAQRPHRTAAARKALGFRVAKKGRRSAAMAGHSYRVRHSGMQQPTRCVTRIRKVSR